ncbi:MarR family transcriptional regulator [Actinoplanes sp. TBRC 11911]|uniref:MarR family winged helix-turn-helix transcriptional regulator n=1 Tax=Actinoplanes sp. TBRC 11911 TaxID=2729386 RepID=UPI00289E9944|nr:MarR family transcriptional regulator [Actinoplanes sp. TBRC 11911]
MERSDVDARLIDALAQTAFSVMAVLNRVGAENDLSLTQLRVMGILRDRRLRMTALADYLGLEKSTMTGLVDRAEKRGLLGRAPSETDGRAVDVFLTPAGEELVGPVYRRVVELLAPMVETLRPAERRQLQAHLETMLGPPLP